MTQYRALFSDEDIALPSPDSVNEPCIFYTWIAEQVNNLALLGASTTDGKTQRI